MMHPYLIDISSAFSAVGSAVNPQDIIISGEGELPSWFDVTGMATATIGTAGLMLARLAGPENAAPVKIDKRLASLWFGMTLRPSGWQVPPPWDPIAGDYRTRDGWIRLHTNAPHHRAAALSVLGSHTERKALQNTVAGWNADELESSIVEAGGCAAVMRDLESWSDHPQGRAVSQEPLILWRDHGLTEPGNRRPVPDRPLAGVKILDLTRVLAGPVAGRFLAAYGADVLRIDPPDWEEPGVVPEVTLGKRCAGLDLKTPEDRDAFERLLTRTDVLLHGYRPEALVNLGYGPDVLRQVNPSAIDVSLNAYGWSGPWANRRGFDSLLQMSCGIADYGMRMSGADRPVPLPVQALDHSTGYLMAAAILHALDERSRSGRVLSARLSLARTARLLGVSAQSGLKGYLPEQAGEDFDPQIENTAWGPAHRIRFPLEISGVAHSWDYPAGNLRSALARW
jgi:hypothetical protein